MNPALIKLALDAKKNISSQNETTGRTKYDAEIALYKAEKRSRVVRTGFIIAGGAAALFAGIKIAKKIKASQSQKDSSPEMLLAKQLSAAFVGTWYDGTDETLVLASAYQISKSKIKFKKVQNSYKKLTGKDLLTDLKSEVSAAEYVKFIKIVSGKQPEGGDADNPDYYNAGKIAVFINPGGSYYAGATDFFSKIDIPRAGFVHNIRTTGLTQKAWRTKYGLPFEVKMIELKMVGEINRYWVRDDEVKLYPFSDWRKLMKSGYASYGF